MGIESRAASIALQDYSAAATGFFGGIRLPASFIAGASLGQLFALSDASKKLRSRDKTTTDRLLVLAHNAFIGLAFGFSVVTVVISTAANVAVLHGRFDSLAETGYLLLKREFGFEFMFCRLGFLSSLMCFLSGVTCRILYEYELLKVKEKNGALGIVFGMVSLVSLLNSYINTTLFCWPNLFAMAVYVFKEYVKQAIEMRSPMQIVSLVSLILSLVYLVRTVVSNTVETITVLVEETVEWISE